MATAAVVGLTVGAAATRVACLPALSPSSRPALAGSLRLHSTSSSKTSSRSLKFLTLPVRATSSDDTSTSSIQTEDLVATIKEKWDAIENKSSVLIYGGGALLAVWISSIVVGAINSVPLLPKVMELVGLGYTGWFVYRYLLFKSSRKELAEDIEEIKKKITGSTSE